MWAWLKSNTVNLFVWDSLRTFCAAGKDVLYEAINREDWSWRALHSRVAHKALQQWAHPGGTSSFVFTEFSTLSLPTRLDAQRQRFLLFAEPVVHAPVLPGLFDMEVQPHTISVLFP
jgi:hypothetical protein